jgi:hypothetical protein
MQGYTTLPENNSVYVSEPIPTVNQPITIFVPINELVAIQQKYPHPQFLVPVTVLPTAPRVHAELQHYHYPQAPVSESGCCTKPNFKTLGHGVLALSILLLLCAITYTVWTIILLGNDFSNGRIDRDFFIQATVFGILFLITTCVGIASGAHTVNKRDQFICTIITLIGQVIFMTSSIISTIAMSTYGEKRSWQDGAVAQIFSYIAVGCICGLVLPAIGVTAARIDAYRREANTHERLH